jgi:O-antigen ligase
VATLSGGWLWTKGYYVFDRRERWISGFAVISLFAFLHFLSVRSGLLALYVALLYSTWRYVSRDGNWRYGLLFGLALLVIPAIAVNAVPSLKQRVGYMLYDLGKFRSAEGGESYSDSERLVSLQVGLDIWRHAPLLGAGMGDLPAVTQQTTDRLFPKYVETPKMPHNQWIYLMAGTGLLGLVLSFLGLLYPLTRLRYRRFYLFSAFQWVIFVSFLVEYTLETSIGAAFYLFYTLWWMKMRDEEQQMNDE